jgi:hypothetical protein
MQVDWNYFLMNFYEASENSHSIPPGVIDCIRKHNKRDIDHQCHSIFVCNNVRAENCNSAWFMWCSISLFDYTFGEAAEQKQDASIVWNVTEKFSDCLSGELTLEICACEIEAENWKIAVAKCGGCQLIGSFPLSWLQISAHQSSKSFFYGIHFNPTNARMLFLCEASPICWKFLVILWLASPPFKYLLIIYACRRIVWIYLCASPSPPAPFHIKLENLFVSLKYEFIPTPHFDAFCCMRAEAQGLFVKSGNNKIVLKEFRKVYVCMLPNGKLNK